jgi:hypothetical protein
VPLKHHYRKNRGGLPEIEAATGLAKGSLSSGLIFPLSCFASGQALIHQGVQGKFAKNKRINLGKKKCSRQKTLCRAKVRFSLPWYTSPIPFSS